MKAISIRQPFAHYIVTGDKKIEYRSWRTNYRGPILIHASLKVAMNQHELEEYCEESGYVQR
ncbi:MAG: ASCH domain-containing protein [Candidatus Omnitrophica bacterium]|nr:ASCH domain-containing protein [Candidatus Omnitrophota bacterium]